MSSLVELAKLPQYARDAAEARFTILRLCDAYIAVAALGRTEGTARFCDAYNSPISSLGRGDEFAQVRKEIGEQLIPRTIFRWRAALKDHGPVGLAPKYGNRAGAGAIDRSADLQEYLIAHYARFPHARPALVMTSLQTDHPEWATLVTEKQIREYLHRWKDRNPHLAMKLANPDRAKSLFQPAMGKADEKVSGLNDVWEIDSTAGDVTLVNGRHAVIQILDVWSRRTMFFVARTSTSANVGLLLVRAIRKWGKPRAVRTDNGQDFVSLFVQALFRDLEIEPLVCRPFASEQKPYVERHFRTFSHDVLELLPGFSGHNVAEAQAIRSRASFAKRLGDPDAALDVKLTAPELQKFCDDWCIAKYERSYHRGLGMTPFERANSWRGETFFVSAEEDKGLDVLLLDAGTRTVRKKGIEIDGAWHIAAELGGLEGQQVRVRRDPNDISRILVFSATGARICEAVCPERADFKVNRAAVAMEAKSIAAAEMREATKTARAAIRRHSLDTVAERTMARLSREAAQVTALPRRGEEFSTEALRGAADTANVLAELAREQTPAAPRTFEQRVQSRHSIEDENNELWDRYCGLRTRLIDGQLLNEADLAWMRNLERQPFFKLRLKLEQMDRGNEPAVIRAIAAG